MKGGFLNLIERLKKGGVKFVLVGGFAGVVHGCTYVTQDIDICCDFSADNLLALQKVLKELHPVHRMTPQRLKLKLTVESCTRFKNLYLDTDIGQVDCLASIDGLGDYKDVEKLSEITDLGGGLRIRVLTVDSLIKARKAMKRPRDREAVLQLEAIKKMQKKNREI
ncbi:MAG: nucleotidyltransferase [Phycisphaerae bacterium]|nr:nucleotidyltransferase [Phycisphaerae bacterium]